MQTHPLSKAATPETKKKSGTTPFFQPKLTVNTPGDAYEREADQVADQVMRMKEDEEPVVQRMPLTPISGVQRMCADCEEKQEGKVQRQETTSGAGGGQTAPSVVSQVLSSGGGRPMETGTRQFMESRFGQDFGQVRIHTGGQAAESASAIQAKAYTSGRDIVFGEGAYRPESGEGKRLLAHELVHVGQQSGGQSKGIQTYRDRYYKTESGKTRKTWNYGKADDTTLIEDSFRISKDKEKKPWIESITVQLTGKKTDANGFEMWVGTATAKYFANAHKLPDLVVNIAAGSKDLGNTTASPAKGFKVKRIEGIGYNSGKYSAAYARGEREGPKNRYSVDLRGNMNYAIFFHGGEALHAGPGDESSHGCVHIDWSDTATIKQMNYHSVINLTRVFIKY